MSRKSKLFIHMIGNTHFDPVWLWTWDEGMSSIRSTCQAALDRMDEETEFIYSFSCPPVFEWIRKVDPNMFDKIKQRVKEGRWELAEGWWLQPDCNVASGESYARQGLYGQHYLLEHFGHISRSAFNIDSFGHSAMLPQILRKSGIKYYSFSRPGEQEKTLPDQAFIWESPDGSSVLAYRDNNSYLKDVEKNIRNTAECINVIDHDMMLVYGITNHGGAPTKKAINKIKALCTDSSLPCGVRFSTLSGFFNSLDATALPVIYDELVTHSFGVFSNYPEIKQMNRQCEYALLNAEKAAVIAKQVNNIDYPWEKLTSCWTDLLFNQFHDIIGGACIKPAYFNARNLHGRILQSTSEVLHYSLQSVTKDISLPATGSMWNVIVWNLNAFDIDASIEAEVQWAWEFEWYAGEISIIDAEGNEYPCQFVCERSVIPGFRSRFVFSSALPSLGYKAFQVLRRPPAVGTGGNLVADNYNMESQKYRVEICRETGCIASVYDKQQRRIILEDGSKPTVRQDDGDTWAFNVDGLGDVLGVFKLEESKLIENGPVRTVICTKASFGHSYLEQIFTLYKENNTIDNKFRIFWREKHKVLKLGFNMLMENPTVTAAIPYGSIKRRNDGVEMPMGEWLDLSEETRGVSILTDSLFSYDVNGAITSLTVLRSAIFGDLRLPKGLDPNAHYEYLGQGITEGQWKMVFHDGKWRKAKTPQLAMQFCNPPMTIIEANHGGSLPQQDSYASMDGASSILTVIKQAEVGKGLIVRAYEYAGKEDCASMTIAGHTNKIKMDKYEIKTIRLNQDKLFETNILEASGATNYEGKS